LFDVAQPVVPPLLDEGHHAACVDAWLERAAPGGSQSLEGLLRLFEAALSALWSRTKTTLGEVTLSAIAERVLHNASETFPFLASFEVDPKDGIQCGDLRERRDALRDAELKEGLRFVLVEFLTVIGNLTAEILTPELHAELTQVGAPEAIRAARAVQDTPINPQGSGREDGRS
jgi:hypothetical protein